MIECSPQELIASSMLNCFASLAPSKHVELVKSVPKEKFNFLSPRKNQKISLKKTGSLKQLHYKPILLT
jgi:hypothetical protein